MSQFLKQYSTTVISFGPFLDKTDGVTLETGLVEAIDHITTGIFLSKNGGALAIRNQTIAPSVYDAHGCYRVTLDATDTMVLGSLRVIYTDAVTCLPVWQDFQVVTANIWDTLFSTDIFDVNVLTQANIDFGALQKASITAAVPTAAQIQTELEENGASILDTIRDKLPTNYFMGSSDVDNHDTDIDSILVDTGTTLDDNIDFIRKTIENKKTISKTGNVWSLTIYDDNETTPIVVKALKDSIEANITDLESGQLAQELANSV